MEQNQLRALDLFCGAGGSTKGLQQAGYHVTGVDAQPQPRYPGDVFIQENVLALHPIYLTGFDLIIASPPCQRYSTITVAGIQNSMEHPDLVPQTRALLKASGRPYIIENVPGAPLLNYITLCGTMFATLRVIRHRRFESNLSLTAPYHIPQDEHPATYSCNQRARNTRNEFEDFVSVVANNCSLGAAADAMQISWMTRKEIAQAIPPPYMKYLGKQAASIINYRKTQLAQLPPLAPA